MIRDFVAAALPWVLTGLAVAVICAGNRRNGAKADQSRDSERIAVGMSLGLLAGVALNYCGLWENHAIGLAIGPLWGMALATLFGGKDSSNDKNDHKL